MIDSPADTATDLPSRAENRRLLLQIMLVFAMTLTIGAVIAFLDEQRHVDAARAEAAHVAEQHAHRLDQNIRQALSATYALAALVRQGDGRVSEFERTAREMLQLYPGVGALQLAPDGIVSHSVPLEGNEKAIGHNLLRDIKRNKEAILAKETRRLTLAGPFSLVQGGSAAIGRLPVFLPVPGGEDRFWGFTSALIRFPEVLQSAGLNELEKNGYRYGLWRTHPDSGERQTISGAGAGLKDPVEKRISVPNGEWVLHVTPEKGWHDLAGRALRIGMVLAFTVLFTLVAAIQLRQPLLLRKEVARRTRELRQREEMLTSINELSSDWYWETDADHRFTSLSEGIERIIGLKPADLVGKHPWDLASTLAEAEWDGYRRVLEYRGTFRDFVFGIHHPDGSIRYISASGRPVFDAEGELAGYHGSTRDITARRLAEQQRIESEARFQALFEQAPVALSVTTDEDGFVATRWNAAWLRAFGYDSATAQGHSGNEIGLWCNPQDRDRYNQDVTMDGRSGTREVEMRRADGSIRTVSVSGTLIASGSHRQLLTSYDDITERRQAETTLRDTLQRLELHISATPLAVIDWDVNFRVTAWNPAAERIFGYSREEAFGRHASFIVPERYRYRIEGVMKALFDKTGGHRSNDQNVTKLGTTIECEWYNTPITDGSGKVVALSSLVHDVTDRVQYMRALEYQAHHDRLTQLYNRNWLASELEQRIRTQPNAPFSVFFADLDRFKEINDTLGHRIGDELLIEISARLKRDAETRDCLVARLGGDEFAILGADRMSEQMAGELLATLRQPIALSGMNLEVGAGIGIAHYPEHGRDAASLMRCADIAMYHAKSMSSGHTTYSPEIDTYSQEQLTLMNDLRAAIRNDELQLHFQPKVNLAENRLVGLEALLRWQHPERGMVPPGRFIPHAEFTDLMQPITLWVIESAMRQWREWSNDGTSMSIAINLSSRNLLEETLPDHVGSLLGSYQVPPSCIEFEITESAVMTDPTKALSVLHRLRNLGVTLSIDDFGTGYSSLTYLRRLPVQKLKIDASFVMGMQASREDQLIVESTISLAHSLGLKVVAEGVEDAETLTALLELGCDEAQGFYLARPMPAAALAGWQPPA